MQITVEKLPKSQAKITVELSEEDVIKHRERTAEELSKEIKIPGFREGKAPADVVEKQIGAERFFSYILEKAISNSYAKAIIDEKLKVASHPKVKITSQKPLKYEATVALVPEVKVKDYHKIEVPKENCTVEEKEVEAALKEFQKYHATLHPVSRPVQKGDRVEIDFEGTDFSGKPVEGTKSANHPLIVGEAMLVPDFENNLVSMQQGESKSFPITFPKDYSHKPFQGKFVNFKVTLKKVEEVKIPEITEEFLEQVIGTRMTAEALRERIKKNLESKKEENNRMKREDKFIEELLKRIDVELPEILVQEEVEYLVEELKADLERKKIDFKKYLEKFRKNEAELRKELQKEAEKRLRLRFGLMELFQEEKIEVMEEEVSSEIEKITANFPEYKKRTLRAQIRNRMMLDKLFEKLVHSKE